MKRKYIIFAVIIMLHGIVLALLGMANIDSAPIVIGNIPEYSGTVTEFFADMKAGEYERAMEHVGNYDTLGFEKESTELIELYKQTIVSCYDVKLTEPLGDAPESRLEAVQGIEFTYFDCRLLHSAVSEMTADAAMDYMNSGSIIETDEQALAFVNDALYECLSEPEQYCVTERFDIRLKYDGKDWKIELEQPLVDAMFGYIGSLPAEGEE